MEGPGPLYLVHAGLFVVKSGRQSSREGLVILAVESAVSSGERLPDRFLVGLELENDLGACLRLSISLTRPPLEMWSQLTDLVWIIL